MKMRELSEKQRREGEVRGKGGKENVCTWQLAPLTYATASNEICYIL